MMPVDSSRAVLAAFLIYDTGLPQYILKSLTAPLVMSPGSYPSLRFSVMAQLAVAENSSEIAIARHVVVADRIAYTSVSSDVLFWRVYPGLTPVVEVDHSLACVWAEPNRGDSSHHVRAVNK